jgi:hypothetical protein
MTWRERVQIRQRFAEIGRFRYAHNRILILRMADATSLENARKFDQLRVNRPVLALGDERVDPGPVQLELDVAAGRGMDRALESATGCLQPAPDAPGADAHRLDDVGKPARLS